MVRDGRRSSSMLPPFASLITAQGLLNACKCGPIFLISCPQVTAGCAVGFQLPSGAVHPAACVSFCIVPNMACSVFNPVSESCGRNGHEGSRACGSEGSTELASNCNCSAAAAALAPAEPQPPMTLLTLPLILSWTQGKKEEKAIRDTTITTAADANHRGNNLGGLGRVSLIHASGRISFVLSNLGGGRSNGRNGRTARGRRGGRGGGGSATAPPTAYSHYSCRAWPPTDLSNGIELQRSVNRSTMTVAAAAQPPSPPSSCCAPPALPLDPLTSTPLSTPAWTPTTMTSADAPTPIHLQPCTGNGATTAFSFWSLRCCMAHSHFWCTRPLVPCDGSLPSFLHERHAAALDAQIHVRYLQSQS